MAITQAMCTSFKKELLEGGHNFKTSGAGGNSFNIALYTSSASLDASTTAYTTSNEASGTGYTAKGKLLTNVTPTTGGTTAFVDFQDLTFPSVTLTAAGAAIYKSTGGGNELVLVLDFGGNKTATNGTFTVTFPDPTTPANAIISMA